MASGRKLDYRGEERDDPAGTHLRPNGVGPHENKAPRTLLPQRRGRAPVCRVPSGPQPSSCIGWLTPLFANPLVSRVKNKNGKEEKNGTDDRGSVCPSGDQIEVVTETRSSSEEKAPRISTNKPHDQRETPEGTLQRQKAGRGERVGRPGPRGPSGTEALTAAAAAASEGGRGDGPAPAEHQGRSGCTQGAPGPCGGHRRGEGPGEARSVQRRPLFPADTPPSQCVDSAPP